MRIAVTGATGYIGQRLVSAALCAGHEVLAMTRRPVSQRGVTWRHFDFCDVSDLSFPRDLDVVFHLAADTQSPSDSAQTEQQAARRLIDAANAVGARFVFVSSQTAREDAPTPYGRIKSQIESAALSAGGCVIRPGQVYGGPERGLFGVLGALVRRMPVLPAFVPAPQVQPVHVDDLVQALLACANVPPASLLRVASPEAISFTSFLRAIARGRSSRRPLFVPVPTVLVRVAATLAGPRLSGRLGLDRLGSLFALPRMETAGDLQRLQLKLRPLSAGMTRSGGGRRELIAEGRALLAYVLRRRPTGGLVRRYVRAVEALRSARPLQLPDLFLRVPAMIALLDGAGCVAKVLRSEFAWRLNAALTLAEASPQGACRFLGSDHGRGWLRSSAHLAVAVLKEAARRILQLLLRPLLARVGRRREAV